MNWISILRQTPKAYTDVLLALSDGSVRVGSRFPSIGFDWPEADGDEDKDIFVQHWTPLPEHPEAAKP